MYQKSDILRAGPSGLTWRYCNDKKAAAQKLIRSSLPDPSYCREDLRLIEKTWTPNKTQQARVQVAVIEECHRQATARTANLSPAPPLEPMPRLTVHLKSPALHIKRDDLTGQAFGGNKTRRFEFPLADALAAGADTIVSGVAVQSNYCRQLAAACAKLGLELHLILRPVRDIDKTESQATIFLNTCSARILR